MKRKIKADFEHLQKLFILPDSKDRFLDFGNELLNMLHSYFAEKGGIHSKITMKELDRLFSKIDVPKDPMLLKDLFQEIKSTVISHSVKVSSPYYIGHMTSATPYFTILIDMIISALNQNQVKIETAKASTFLEREFVAVIHRLLFKRSSVFYKRKVQDHSIALGNVAIDGTLANLTALLVARNKLFRPDGDFKGIDREGIAKAYDHYNCEKAVIFVSKRGHYSIDKITRILGIGQDSVVKIPVDVNNRIDLSVLAKEIDIIKDHNRRNPKKILIMAIIGIAGTTETGNIDDLVGLRKIADKVGTHFHIDAAWGGPVLIVDKYRYMFKGIETADSVTFDCHKLFYAPLSLGMVLFKNENDLSLLKHNTNYIIRPDSRDQGRFTIEGSRPFSSLKPWAVMKVIGSEGFSILFENAFNITEYLKKSIEIHDNFELLNNPELFITNYRFIPRRIKEMLDEIRTGREAFRSSLVEEINGLMNELNVQLHRALREKDNSFVSRTVLESTKYAPSEVTVLRAITINPLTTFSVIQEIIDEQNSTGIELYKRNYEKKIIKMMKVR